MEVASCIMASLLMVLTPSLADKKAARRARALAPMAYISQGNGTGTGTDIRYTVLLSGISGIF